MPQWILSGPVSRSRQPAGKAACLPAEKEFQIAREAGGAVDNFPHFEAGFCR